jgi:hypothetical protein
MREREEELERLKKAHKSKMRQDKNPRGLTIGLNLKKASKPPRTTPVYKDETEEEEEDGERGTKISVSRLVGKVNQDKQTKVETKRKAEHEIWQRYNKKAPTSRQKRQPKAHVELNSSLDVIMSKVRPFFHRHRLSSTSPTSPHLTYTADLSLLSPPPIIQLPSLGSLPPDVYLRLRLPERNT